MVIPTFTKGIIISSKPKSILYHKIKNNPKRLSRGFMKEVQERFRVLRQKGCQVAHKRPYSTEESNDFNDLLVTKEYNVKKYSLWAVNPHCLQTNVSRKY